MTNNNSLFVPRVFRRNRPPTPNLCGEDAEEGLLFRFEFTEQQQQQQQQQQQEQEQQQQQQQERL